MNLIGWNVVITANNFNPSIITQAWLIKQEIIAEAEFQPPAVLAEGVSQVQTNQFQLLVMPQMMQFVTNAGIEDEGQVIQQRVGALVKALPHTPYAAIGLNFTWAVDLIEGETMQELTRRLFYNSGHALFDMFDAPDARFGAYLSRDYRNVRLKVDIKPGTLNIAPDEKLLFIMNFHKTLQLEKAVEEISSVLTLWDEAKAESRRIVDATMERNNA